MACHDGCGLCRVNINSISVKKGNDLLLDGVSLIMNCGELTAIIGTNGAGKTTLLRTILGEIPHEGTVTHEDCTGECLERITVGYVPQFLDFDRSMPISVEDFIMAGRTSSPVCFAKNRRLREAIKKELRDMGCEGLLCKKLGELSGGELQRVMLVQALTPSPELLILDEPVSGVDLVAGEKFYKTINRLKKERHMAIAMVSHDLSLVKQYADRVALLNKKILKSGSVDEVFNSEEFKKEFQQL